MTAPPPVYEGTVLAGKYRVERVIGSGGMGVVVAARHIALDERVAIKFLLPQAASSPEVVTRFLREGRAAARVRSEHVARVYDVGTLADGAPYLVMEHLEGNDLGALLRARGPLELRVAVDYVLQACEALADAHALGVVHRDLKPSNLFLTQKSDGTPSVKLIDFGISKLAGQREGDVAVTASSIMMGSPLFMAPEQMKSARDVDARADVWSLGGILYMLLTGRAPFVGETVMGIYDQILLGAPKASASVPGLPPEIDAAISRCLERDLSRRFADVAQIAAAIAPFGPPGADERAARIARILNAGRPPAPITPSTAPPASHTAPLPSSPPVAPSTPAPARSGPSGSGPEPGLASDGPWNATHGDAKKKSARPLVIVLSLGAALVVAATIAFGLRGRGQNDAPAALPAASESIAPPPPTPTPTPSATPSSATPADPTPEPSATASASATASTKATPRSRPGGRAPDKPKRDLFGDPR